MSDESDGTPFDDFLRSLLGDEAGEEAARAMRAQGFDPSSMPAEYSDPAHLEQVLNQFRFIMSTTSGPVNWGLVEGAAKQQAFTAGDPRPSAAEAAAAKQAMTVADLWLDTVTDFSAGPAERQAWSRAQWIDATLPMWKRICEPVAANVSRALSAALEDQMGEGGDLPAGVAAMLGQTQEMMPKLSAMMFASQIGRALSALAQEAIGSYDVGVPLAPARTTALLPHNIAVFSEGLDIDFTEVRQFMAVREAAHRRLFASVPWLSGDLLRAVEAYSAEIAIDPAAIARAAGSVDPSDPESIERALSGGVFAISVTEAQHRALTRLETLLALIEGWVEVVTAAATAPYLPHSDQLREMMRRRRASGSPAEEVLGRLIGLSAGRERELEDLYRRSARHARAVAERIVFTDAAVHGSTASAPSSTVSTAQPHSQESPPPRSAGSARSSRARSRRDTGAAAFKGSRRASRPRTTRRRPEGPYPWS